MSLETTRQNDFRILVLRLSRETSFLNALANSFNHYLLSLYSVLHTSLVAGKLSANKTDKTHTVCILVLETDQHSIRGDENIYG